VYSAETRAFLAKIAANSRGADVVRNAHHEPVGDPMEIAVLADAENASVTRSRPGSRTKAGRLSVRPASR